MAKQVSELQIVKKKRLKSRFGLNNCKILFFKETAFQPDKVNFFCSYNQKMRKEEFFKFVRVNF